MIKQSAYLYPNRQDLYSNLDAVQTGYRKMYARPLKLHKGIDNTIEFRLLNNDQKLLNVVGSTMYWIVLDRDTSELIYQTQYTVQGSDNSLIRLTIPEADLEPIASGKYMYSTYLVDNLGNKSILYGDSQFGPTVPVEIVANSFPQVLPSVTVSDFFTSEQLNYAQPDNSKYSSAIYADPEKNSTNNALHTAVFYTNGFEGQINIEVSLENAIGDTVVWSTLTNQAVTADQNISYLNFNGIFGFVRFRSVPAQSNTGTVDKILYRS
jgi:hypothetical protein